MVMGRSRTRRTIERISTPFANQREMPNSFSISAIRQLVGRE
jgi:hypothetical protein